MEIEEDYHEAYALQRDRELPELFVPRKAVEEYHAGPLLALEVEGRGKDEAVEHFPAARKARGKKLEKYEQEFWRNNKAIMALDFETAKPKTADEKLSDMFNDLLAEAGD